MTPVVLKLAPLRPSSLSVQSGGRGGGGEEEWHEKGPGLNSSQGRLEQDLIWGRGGEGRERERAQERERAREREYENIKETGKGIGK